MSQTRSYNKKDTLQLETKANLFEFNKRMNSSGKWFGVFNKLYGFFKKAFNAFKSKNVLSTFKSALSITSIAIDIISWVLGAIKFAFEPNRNINRTKDFIIDGGWKFAQIILAVFFTAISIPVLLGSLTIGMIMDLIKNFGNVLWYFGGMIAASDLKQKEKHYSDLKTSIVEFLITAGFIALTPFVVIAKEIAITFITLFALNLVSRKLYPQLKEPVKNFVMNKVLSGAEIKPKKIKAAPIYLKILENKNDSGQRHIQHLSSVQTKNTNLPNGKYKMANLNPSKLSPQAKVNPQPRLTGFSQFYKNSVTKIGSIENILERLNILRAQIQQDIDTKKGWSRLEEPKRKQKIHVLEKFSFILRQLRLFKNQKLLNNTEKKLLYLGTESEFAAKEGIYIVFENFSKDKKQVFAEIKKHLGMNYEHARQSFFAQKGDVESIIDSIEAFFNQKPAAELAKDIDELIDKYNEQLAMPSDSHGKELRDAQREKKIDLLKWIKDFTKELSENPQKLKYTYSAIFKNPREFNFISEEGKNAAVKTIRDWVLENHSGASSSFADKGRTADFFDKAMNLFCAANFSSPSRPPSLSASKARVY